MPPRVVALLAISLAWSLLPGCAPAGAGVTPRQSASAGRSVGTGSAGTASTPRSAAIPAIAPLPRDTDVDYQLGGASDPAAHVGIVARDRAALPAAGRYNICYVNAFQTQPGEKSFWKKRPQLLLRHQKKVVVDSAWGEWLLDIGTRRKRAKLAVIVGAWIKGCAASGYDAVEFDNLDSYTRSRRELKRSDAIAFARALIGTAHAAGLAAGQKNLATYDGTRIGFDFAVAEECGRWRECDDYTAHYGRQLIVIEYRAVDFAWTCQHYGDQLAVVLRDRGLTPDGVHEWC